MSSNLLYALKINKLPSLARLLIVFVISGALHDVSRGSLEQLPGESSSSADQNPMCSLDTETLELRSSVDSRGYLGEDINDYPEEEINNILRRTPVIMKELFNVRDTPLDPANNLTDRVSSYSSATDGLVEENVCRAIVRYVYPREARRFNTRVYVPNTSEFVQVIQVDVCENPNTACGYVQDNLPYGLESSCTQKYSFKRLMYLDSRRGRMSSDVFRYPSCCSCYVRAFPVERSREPTTRSAATNSVSRPKEINEITINGASLESITLTRLSPNLNCPKSGKRKSDIGTRKPHVTTKKPKSITDEPLQPLRQPPNPSRAPTRSQPAKHPISSVKPKVTTHNTVVLQSDKVYVPGDES